MLKLSVLDQSAAASGRSQDTAIRQTLDLAIQCEAWGYHRFWVSEHHSHPSIVGTAPEVLMAAIAARTTRIRLGSAGVMLPHYAPLKVAEQFRVLDALAPGRIDLGVGRAPGSDGRTAQLLNPDRHASDNFPQQVMELQAWVTGEPIPAGHPGHGVYAYPSGPTSPDVWMLGSSDYGAQLAAHLGLPYAFAYFITEGQGVDNAFNLYRANYRPNERNPKPRATVCVWALAADTEDEAWRLFQSRARWKMDRNTGRIGALLPPDQAVRDYNASEQVAMAELRAGALVGSAPQVADKLRKLAERLQLDEVVIITWTHEPAAQARSYELLAKEFSLTTST
ncbi:LLM class flavin-dependent oxidoreductase [Limnohabitans sp. TEGF004]|uniref:LLM class flavin-dependent oxidoreductase n=1 Tax=Limnohabitans sp. TEGF004 TaxID=2986281 RepID=UPI002376E4B1|nr:LLM class flavin-dependent oxidoreductase [Limnohabitans sp. TEGF004]BDU54998.1 N5,N10-methylene tetrahydromethanopterin reductase [Limnohabitans sp. TEGF004]